MHLPHRFAPWYSMTQTVEVFESSWGLQQKLISFFHLHSNLCSFQTLRQWHFWGHMTFVCVLTFMLNDSCILELSIIFSLGWKGETKERLRGATPIGKKKKLWRGNAVTWKTNWDDKGECSLHMYDRTVLSVSVTCGQSQDLALHYSSETNSKAVLIIIK
jgi:hypothetical protein